MELIIVDAVSSTQFTTYILDTPFPTEDANQEEMMLFMDEAIALYAKWAKGKLISFYDANQ